MMKNRFLTIFVCIFAAAVLVFGGTLGIVVGVRNSRAVVSYENARADAGALRYLSANYKINYIRALKASGVKANDTENFWNSTDESGVTYKELFAESFEEYVRALVASANVFLTYSSYTKADKESVRATVEEILEYKAGGSEKEFNAMAEKYGFDYDDFCSAAELLYKAGRAKNVIYGADGEALVYSPEECAKYLETYSHVSLLFVRTEEVFQTDEEGNIVYGDNGSALMREMTAEEKAERQAIIDKLTAAIEAKKNGGDYQITPEMFEIYLEKSDGDAKMHDKGYYFNENADATLEFATEFPEIVECALGMELKTFAKVDCSIGVCFIYKYDAMKGAYSDADNLFFSDFYSDASNYLYEDILNTLSPEVKVKDEFFDTDYSAIPLLSEFVISQWN